ncbi:MAG: AgmX/PglI C-terminal domain-containing protein [Anaeromyxobacter sp.]|nr:AgmX/PglI C-terminal domain-containing protein [Anaeromyxobacter sp.]MBL0276581.1 AgmX/PglI C-terminal domain-containing protein [Anaeromyxobacter sp.]
MAAQQHKVLRIGVIQGGKIVEERIIPARQSITLGTSAKNTIVVPQSNLPASVTVFAWQGDRYHLWFEQGMDGRIQGPQGAADFGALVSQGLAKKEGRGHSVPVGEDQRGNVVIGEVKLLWQFVTPPPEAPRPVLPREAKGNHFKSMDRLFVTLLALSFLVHGGAYVALANTELPPEVTLEEIPDRYAKLLIPDRLPAPPVEAKEEAKAGSEEKKPDEGEAKKGEPKKGDKTAETAEQAAARKAARAAAVAKAVSSKGMLKVLGALGPGTGSGAVADVFGAGGGMTDVATALSGAGGVAVATDPAAGGGRKGGGQGGAASIGDLATSGGGAVGYGAKSEVRVSGSVAAEEAEVDSADIDQAKLAAFVRARMGLIKACYENALKRNPSLKGKISIRFTILETGGLADIQAALNSLGSPEVASCIMNTMRTWRTQFRPSGPVTVEYPFVFAPVN